jgi:hypothetical protein
MHRIFLPELIAKLLKSSCGLSLPLPPPPPISTSSNSATQRVSPQQLTTAIGDAAAAALDPLLSESRTIYKVKRFLCTLIQFGTDISADTGEKVKELVFNLVVSRENIIAILPLGQRIGRMANWIS